MTREWNWYVEYTSQHHGYMYAIERVLYSGETPYQKVNIVDTYTFGRTLILDGKVQSAQFDEHVYHEALIHPAMNLHPQPRRVIILGGGEGAVLRELCRYPQLEKILMVDIDEKVVNLCREYLPEWSGGCFDDPRVELLHMDARRFLKETTQRFDIIYSDLTEPVEEGPSRLLFTKEFYRLVHDRLAPGGLLAVQAGGLSLDYPTIHAAIRNTLSLSFKHVHSYHTFIPSFDCDWGYVLAGDDLDPLAKPVEQLDRELADLAPRLKFYDGQTHHGMFYLPKDVRHVLDKEKTIIEDDRPLCIY